MFGFEYERAKLPYKLKNKILLYYIARYALINKKYQTSFKNIRQDERNRVAQLILDGAPHKPKSCDNACDAHIIVQFIQSIK
jgi:hypothetical protein